MLKQVKVVISESLKMQNPFRNNSLWVRCAIVEKVFDLCAIEEFKFIKEASYKKLGQSIYCFLKLKL